MAKVRLTFVYIRHHKNYSMRKYLLLLLAFIAFGTVQAQDSEGENLDTLELTEELAAFFRETDSINKTFTFQKGKIELGGGLATLNVPKGFKYLDSEQSYRLLVDIWGNPPSVGTTMGIVMAEDANVMDMDGVVYTISYEEIGYVEDDDAEDIDYDDLLADLKEETREASKERDAQGYGTMELIGWASKPFYDKKKNILHWAKEMNFDQSDVNTLNYDIRILGRKGVLVITALSDMEQLAKVKKQIPAVLNMTTFNPGSSYADFDENVDEVAAWSLGGLVAGKVLAKVGFFALILKFWKIIGIAIIGGFAAIRKFVTGKKVVKKEEVELPKTDDQTESLNP